MAATETTFFFWTPRDILTGSMAKVLLLIDQCPTIDRGEASSIPLSPCH